MKKIFACIIALVLVCTLSIGVLAASSGVLGDANNDKKVTDDDYVAIMQSLVGYGTEIDSNSSDYNKDGSVDLLDVYEIKNKVGFYSPNY